ncbi:hypothetical protein CUJ83_03080 [Methanocella sp. CWC-04]|uniref:Squalene cyclase C-terminal domain-containing protein n=1 Tax=Methanooceanicella nereidis TaxID=2052831 RepID=A0AAP2RB79_9EURY|nr:hypothetical protein [Methanocella sp. CWC-04]MCD1293979.1 hypothetical protein [Methanocella sp. CWC-04]
MAIWSEHLKYDPIPAFLSSNNEAIIYYVKRDLLDEESGPVSQLWKLPEAQKIIRKQQADGTWKYPGKQIVVYPGHHYRLVETWKQFRYLVEKYEITKEHPAAEKAAEFLFSCQTDEGDIRGMIGNQYATYYTGAIMALLIRAGYADDPRIKKGFKWLLPMRQKDGGWTIPLLTVKFDRKTIYRLTSEYCEPVEPDRSRPFSHNWTGMVLRAFAAHPEYRKCEEARLAGELLKSRFFKKDSYSSYMSASNWIRFQYPFWWPNLLTAFDSLSLMGFSGKDADIRKGLNWFIGHQEMNGLWKTTYVPEKKGSSKDKAEDTQYWISLAICRVFKRFYGSCK